MSRGKTRSADEDVMGAAYDWAGEAGRVHNCGARIVLLPSRRRGVWLVRAQAVDVVDKRAVGVRVQVELEWPTSEYQTFAGALMNALMRLDHELGIDALQQPAV